MENKYIAAFEAKTKFSSIIQEVKKGMKSVDLAEKNGNVHYELGEAEMACVWYTCIAAFLLIYKMAPIGRQNWLAVWHDP